MVITVTEWEPNEKGSFPALLDTSNLLPPAQPLFSIAICHANDISNPNHRLTVICSQSPALVPASIALAGTDVRGAVLGGRSILGIRRISLVAGVIDAILMVGMLDELRWVLYEGRMYECGFQMVCYVVIISSPLFMY